jgi:cytochrome c-type biogenesis protein CcmF
MQMAHLGIAVCALGVVLSSKNSAERDLRLAPGESWTWPVTTSCSRAPSTSKGRTSSPTRAPSGQPRWPEVRAAPGKRLYTVQQSMMTEAGIDAGFTRDLYVALGEPLENGAWAVRCISNLRPLDLAGRSADRPGRVAGGPRPALPRQGQDPGA